MVGIISVAVHTHVLKWKFNGKVHFTFKETHQEKGMIVT